MRRRPGIDGPLCRWLLAYRREAHGPLLHWLSDPLREARALGIAAVEDLPHDLASVDRLHAWALPPLGSAPAGARDAVEAADTTRYLLIAAGEVPDEAHAAEFVAEGAPDRVEVWTVPGAGHVGGLAAAPAEWSDRVTTFLTDTLVAPEG